jgi:hypothetical protein
MGYSIEWFRGEYGFEVMGVFSNGFKSDLTTNEIITVLNNHVKREVMLSSQQYLMLIYIFKRVLNADILSTEFDADILLSEM